MEKCRKSKTHKKKIPLGNNEFKDFSNHNLTQTFQLKVIKHKNAENLKSKDGKGVPEKH